MGSPMAKKAELGEKRICPECGAKFYDLTRNPATCPMCQHSFDPAELEPQEIAPLAPESEDDEAPVADEEDIDEEEEVYNLTFYNDESIKSVFVEK